MFARILNGSTEDSAIKPLLALQSSIFFLLRLLIILIFLTMLERYVRVLVSWYSNHILTINHSCDADRNVTLNLYSILKKIKHFLILMEIVFHIFIQFTRILNNFLSENITNCEILYRELFIFLAVFICFWNCWCYLNIKINQQVNLIWF